MRKLIIIALLLIIVVWQVQAQNYRSVTGEIHFKSDAPLELIEARSDKLQGVIDATKRNFAFKVSIKKFDGFNSSLQREHFNENYLETDEFPTATFSGRIIEKIDFSKDGVYQIRAKGKLKIHGVTQERIIKSTLEIKGDKLLVNSKFTVLLVEHNIAIPKIVYQKIAEEIAVTAKLVFKKP